MISWHNTIPYNSRPGCGIVASVRTFCDGDRDIRLESSTVLTSVELHTVSRSAASHGCTDSGDDLADAAASVKPGEHDPVIPESDCGANATTETQPPHKTAMRAFVVSEHAHPSKIQLTHDAPEPVRKLGSDELLVDVHSAGLNFFDVRFLHLFLHRVRPIANTHSL